MKIIDAIALENTVDDVKKRIAEIDPALIIVNFSTAPFNGDKAVVSAIQKDYNGHVTAIGAHVNLARRGEPPDYRA